MTIVRTRGNAASVITRRDNAAVGIATLGQYLEDITAGTNISIDKTDPSNPIISSTGGTVEGSWVVKGTWDGSTNLFPSASVLKGYQYFNTANSTTLLMADGGIIPAGAIIVAKIDNPGQTVANWYILLSVI